MKPGSKAWKKFMAKLYGIGAAVVILGALFKIQHWPGAGPMLIIGLGTEAVLFIMFAFAPKDIHYHWERVYPQLVDDEYAYEDEEMYNRLKLYGLDEIKLSFDYSAIHLPHQDKKRYENFNR